MSGVLAIARRHGAVALVLAVAVLALVLQARAFDRAASGTYDEGLYVELALETWRGGSFWGYLKYGCAPLPIHLGYGWFAWGLPDVGLAARDVPRVLSTCRAWHLWLAAVPLVLVTALWVHARRGALAAAIAAGLLVASPVVVTQASLATTDCTMSLSALAVLAALVRYRARPGRGRGLLVALALGVALSAKYTTVFLFALAVPVAYAGAARSGRAAMRLLAWTAAAVGVAWAAHGFLVAPFEIASGWEVQGPAPLAGMRFQVGHVRHGQANYLDGERRREGWWDFYPKVVAYKSTPVEWVLLAIALASAASRRQRRDPTCQVWAAAAASYFAFLVALRVALGQRLLLLDYVLVAMLAVDALALVLAPRSLAVVGVLLVGGQVASIAPVHPFAIEYASPCAGGRDGAWRHLVDCNLDWGQSLPPLAAFLADEREARVALAVFAYPTIQPAAYGIDAVHPLTAGPRELALVRWLVVSATELVGVNDGRDPFAALRELDADARIGGALFAYRLERPDVQAAVRVARRISAEPLR